MCISIREFGINPNGGKSKKSLGASAETSRNKKHVAVPPPEAKGVKYISAGAPTEVKKAKDA